MRFAAVQFDIVWEDKPANHAIIEQMLRETRPAIEPGTFVVLPELGDTGFSMNLDQIMDDGTLPWARDLARRMGIFLQPGYAVRKAASGTNSKGRNCAAIIAPDGSILGIYEKFHPFSFGKESEFYSGGDHLTIARCGEFNVCPMICYDLRFPELWRLAALATTSLGSAQVFTIGASWPVARQQHWRALAIARAIENQSYVVAVNRTGADPHLNYAGGSLIISPKGEILAEADARPAVLSADLDLQSLKTWREQFPALRDAHRELLGLISIR